MILQGVPPQRIGAGRYGNCLIFGLWCWITRGGYLILRRSHHGWWPHILWCADLGTAAVEHYVPMAYSAHYAGSHKLLFRGYVSRVEPP